MKKLYLLLILCLICNLSFSQVLASDSFSYADGPLVGNGSWVNTSGTVNTLLLSSGQAVLQMDGSAPEDANMPFAPVSGDIFYGLDFSVTAVTANIGGADSEIFAHFLDATSLFSAWRARIDVDSPSGSGDYTIGISTADGNSDTEWPNDLTFGVTYRAVVRYNQDEDVSELWVNPTSQSDLSVLGNDYIVPLTMVSFGLRQSDSRFNETVFVDNVVVSTSFSEVLGTKNLALREVKLYPNPVNRDDHYVFITTKQNMTKHIEIYNLLGNRIVKTDIEGKELDISKLTSGIYLIKITESNITETRKLVVN